MWADRIIFLSFIIIVILIINVIIVILTKEEDARGLRMCRVAPLAEVGGSIIITIIDQHQPHDHHHRHRHSHHPHHHQEDARGPRMCRVAPLALEVAAAAEGAQQPSRSRSLPHFLPIQTFVVHQNIFFVAFTLIFVILSGKKYVDDFVLFWTGCSMTGLNHIV